MKFYNTYGSGIKSKLTPYHIIGGKLNQRRVPEKGDPAGN